MGRFLRSPSNQKFERPIEETQADGIPSVSTYISGIKVSILTVCVCACVCVCAHAQLRPTVGDPMDCSPPVAMANEAVALVEDCYLPLTLHSGTTLQLKRFLSLKELAHSDTARDTWTWFLLWLLHS